MKIVIAPDSFKGSLTAQQACAAMERGVRSVYPDVEIVSIPMADGGEGTLEALISATNGKSIHADVVDPLGRPIRGVYGILGDNTTAVIEMSKASGLLLLEAKERNPLFTTTYGTGQLIRHALESGYRKIMITIGGSATNDCGTGAAQALGVRFFKKDKTEIRDPMCGELLQEVASLETGSLHPAIRTSSISVACDVTNPLLGEKGCARIYAPQKGATQEDVLLLEEGMLSFINVAEKLMGRSVRDIPGTGAAGGLGAGLMLFLGAAFESGTSLVMNACDFSQKIQGADLILTGEGKIDHQTIYGKTISGITSQAKKLNIPVIAFAGIVENPSDLSPLGLMNLFSIRPESMPVDQAMLKAEALLEETVERILRTVKIP